MSEYLKTVSVMAVLILLLVIVMYTFMYKNEKKESVGPKNDETVIGIDLGTTYSSVGVFRNGEVEIIPNDQGNRITPSFVAFTSEGERLIGDAAKSQLTSNPKNTVFDAKRLIGRRFNDSSLQEDMKYWPFKVVEVNSKPYIKIQTRYGLDREFAPEEITAMILGKMKDIAEAYLGKKVTYAIITVSAFFNDAQRQATYDAASIAGLKVVGLLNKATATALAYSAFKKIGKKKILVYHLGGGTLDVSVFTIDEGVFEVVATNGDTHLGGEDFDKSVIDFIIGLFNSKTRNDIRENKTAMQKLRREVERAKRTLSTQLTTKIEIESFLDGNDFSETLTRARFEELNIDLFRNTLKPVQKVLEDAGLKNSDIDEIVLVGGSTRIPMIQQLVKEFFDDKEPNTDFTHDSIVAYGAATHVDNLLSVDSKPNLVVKEVYPFSLSIKTENSNITKLISRNTVIPTKKSQMFSTTVDNQTNVAFEVYEGELLIPNDNQLLAKYYLTDITPTPKGVTEIEVTFEIDVNGILQVTTDNKKAGNKNDIIIINNRLTNSEIEIMIDDFKKFDYDDKLLMEKLKARNQLESFVYSLKKHADRKFGIVTEDENKKITDLIEENIKWLESNPNAEVDKYNEQKKYLERTVDSIFEVPNLTKFHDKRLLINETVIGIDLGTTYSCVGVFRNGEVEIIPNDQGNRITPSYVAFTSKGERLIGDAAKSQLTSNPKNTVFDAKRLIGRRFNDSSLQEDMKYWPFKVVEVNSKPYIKINTKSGLNRKFAPEEITAMILGKMKDIAEAYLGKKVTYAIITVSAFFNDAQRQATYDAASIAGLKVVRILNEPIAAAIAYGLDKKEGEKNILVFDLGGGTFDVSLLTIDNGVFEVVATNGDTHLGGEDFDNRVMEHFITLFKKKTSKDIRKNNRAVQKLRREVERAKRTLSTQLTTKIEIESFLDGNDFSETLTRARFEELNIDLFRNTLKPVQKVLEDAGLKNSDIDEIVLVGGSTRIPMIQQLVKEFFDGKQPSTGINPDEAVAYGAAVHAGLLSNKHVVDDIVLLDVNPLTLGIETAGGEMAKLIDRNTPIPVMKSQTFTTTTDNQTSVSIKVFEGEHPMTKDNNLLDEFVLDGILLAKQGVPQIEVTFEIDVDGILQVIAKDKNTGNNNNIIINKSRLSNKDIRRMINYEKELVYNDKKVNDKLKARNQLESFLYSIKKKVNKYEKVGAKFSHEEKLTIIKTVEAKLDWLESNPNAQVDDYENEKKSVEKIVNPIIIKLDRFLFNSDKFSVRQPNSHPSKNHETNEL